MGESTTMSEVQRNATSDITIYGATGFVGRYITEYLLETASRTGVPIRLVLAGRNKTKLEQRMKSFVVNDGSSLDLFIADSSDLEGLTKMASQTKVVIACAGPFILYGTNLVAACAATGTDYVDITGEIFWAAQMREKFGDMAKKSGCRIISFCGFDSIPSDLSIFAAVEALREVRGISVEIEQGTTWHTGVGVANAGTLYSALNMPFDVKAMVLDGSGSLREVPFLMEDPLSLTHPTKVRHNPSFEKMRSMLSLAEWLNTLPSIDSVIGGAMSIGFVMAAVNNKVVHASSIALGYGEKFRYYERHLILGFGPSRALGIFSSIPVLIFQLFFAVGAILFMLPYVSRRLLDIMYPPGLGAPDAFNKRCSCEVYAEVFAKAAAPSRNGNVDRAACHITFQGDPGNLVTAQVVSESALALLHNRSTLPPRSEDGFGTPAELIGKILLQRLVDSKVRTVDIQVKVQKDAPRVSFQRLV